MRIRDFDIIHTRNGQFYAVVGTQRWDNQIQCHLLYTPTASNSKRVRSGKRYNKICDNIVEHLRLVPKTYCSTIPRRDGLVYVPSSEIIDVFNPRSAIRSCSEDWLKEFVTPFSRISGIEMTNIGLWGSRLVGLETPESDWDIVVYGRENLSKYLNRFDEIVLNCDLGPLSSRSLKNAATRFSAALGVLDDKLLKILKQRRTKFLRDGVEVSINFAYHDDELPQEIPIGEPRGQVRLHGVITSEYGGFYRPRVYEIDSGEKTVTLQTYTYFFKEVGGPGDEVEIFGDLHGGSAMTIDNRGEYIVPI